MENIVRFVNITQEQYDSIQNKASGNIYFINNTKRVYKGNTLFASELVPVYDGDRKQYSDWRILRDGVDVTSSVQQPTWANANSRWNVFCITQDGGGTISVPGAEDDLSLSWETSHPYEGVHQYTATRIESNFKGYSLAGQSDKLIAPSNGIRKNWLSDDVQTSLDKADAAHTAIESLAGSVDSKADKSALESHVSNTDNPHGVTAAQVGAVPLIQDANGAKTAVTIGIRKGGGAVGASSLANGVSVTASGNFSHAEGFNTTASGLYSHAEGLSTTASGNFSHAEGFNTTASGNYSHAEGFKAQTNPDDKYAYSWNGDETRAKPYVSHGKGTFNVNPEGGLDGIYIGEKKLSEVISDGVANKADKATTLAGYGITDSPTKTSQLVNDSGFITDKQVKPSTENPGCAECADKAKSATDADNVPWEGVTGRPTNLSEFTNDKDYLTPYDVTLWEGHPGAVDHAREAENAHVASLAGQAESVEWENVNNHPTTLDGYGITDAATKAELTALAAKVDAANTALEEIA